MSFFFRIFAADLLCAYVYMCMCAHKREGNKKFKQGYMAKYEYECLALGDADAIIIRHYLAENGVEKPYVIVIDAGKSDDGTKVATHLQEYFGSKHIDLAICTHPDSDHKDGFFDLLDDPEVTIDEFWLTDPACFLKEEYKEDTKMIAQVRRMWNKSTDDSRNLIEEIQERCQRSYSVVADNCHPKLPLTIVAPCRDFYNRIVKDMVALDGKKKYSKADTSMYDENAAVDEAEAKSVMDECIDDSPTNASSLVVLYQPEDGKKVLFAGDTTQESLQWAIDKYGLNNIDLLKVPHHGSKHNLTTPIIETLAPKTSYITASGTQKHPSSAVVYWLSKFGDVFSTHKCSGYLRRAVNVPRLNTRNAHPIKEHLELDI